MKTLIVSRLTARFISAGHPWVRVDRFTRGLEALAPGDAVTLVDDTGRGLASAIADPANEICARVYHRQPGKSFDVAAAIARAWTKRDALHADADAEAGSDCYRVVHGEGDFLPGLRVERHADVLIAVVFCDAIAAHLPAIITALGHCLPNARILIKDHRDDLRRRDVAVRWADGSTVDPDLTVIGRELGVRYPLRPCAGLATGLYVDQRATRAWLRQFAPGARVLNLFAYTGAFSLSLLHAGAATAVDVDLGAPALARASEAAQLNGVANRHRIIHADCRRFLTDSTDLFDIAICDPPTAAQGGDGWIVRRDYPDLLRLLLPRLAPGGLLIACCNTLGGKAFALDTAVSDAANGLRLTPVPAPQLGIDLPQLKGFQEGLPYRLLAVRVEEK